jgi:hypothetical protein
MNRRATILKQQSCAPEAARVLTAALKPYCKQLHYLYAFPLKSSLDELVRSANAHVGPLRSLTKEDREALKDLHASVCKRPDPVGPSEEFWRMPEPNAEKDDLCLPMTAVAEGQEARHASRFAVTMRLRKLLHRWLKSYSEELKVYLAKWVVIKWGGVDRRQQKDKDGRDRHDQKYKSMVQHAETWNESDALDTYAKIAQWSKYLAFRQPQSAAIFDSRVAYSFNWYLRKAGVMRVPALPTENRLLSVLDHRLLIAGHRPGWDELRSRVMGDLASVGHGKDSRILRIVEGDEVISKKLAYTYYVQVLRLVSDKLFGLRDQWRLTKTEMLLFGLATTAVAREVFAEFSRLDRARFGELESFAIPARSFYAR